MDAICGIRAGTVEHEAGADQSKTVAGVDAGWRVESDRQGDNAPGDPAQGRDEAEECCALRRKSHEDGQPRKLNKSTPFPLSYPYSQNPKTMTRAEDDASQMGGVRAQQAVLGEPTSRPSAGKLAPRPFSAPGARIADGDEQTTWRHHEQGPPFRVLVEVAVRPRSGRCLRGMEGEPRRDRTSSTR